MREESDSMGPMEVPDDALWGASTQRAVINFPVSGYPMPKPFIHALGLTKAIAARVNVELGRLDEARGKWIAEAAMEVLAGRHDKQFPVDVFQTGSGTSSNMNANEVIARRARELSGGAIEAHPNDHVNLGQSSNDIVPTVLYVSVARVLRLDLLPALRRLQESCEARSRDLADVVKIGRTHLMDATPLTLGQVFSGYAAQLSKAGVRVEHAIAGLSELAVGGTAVGTGINGHPDFARLVCEGLSRETGISFREADNHFEAQAAHDDAVEAAGVLVTISASLGKIANDIRLLGSGPRAGVGELRLPAIQPGSSIMPGKVNPVMSEMLVQTALYAQGLCLTVANCGRDGHFELNATLPLMAHCLHESIRCLSQATQLFAEKCVDGITANIERCRALTDNSLMLVTALNPHIGYDRAAKVAKEALASGKTLREVVLAKGWLDEKTLDQALDPRQMTGAK